MQENFLKVKYFERELGFPPGRLDSCKNVMVSISALLRLRSFGATLRTNGDGSCLFDLAQFISPRAVRPERSSKGAKSKESGDGSYLFDLAQFISPRAVRPERSSKGAKS
jgi:hypothetical protein